MSFIFSSSFISPNPMIDRDKSIIRSTEINKEYLHLTKDELVDLDLKKDYFYVNNKENKISYVINYINDFTDMVENSLNPKIVLRVNDFLETLSVRITEQIDIEEVTITDYSTVIVDWEKENSLFSLEFGLEEVGYFLEEEGVDVKFNDSINYSDIYNTKLIEDLTEFLGID